MTTESTIDATGAPPVRSSAWLGGFVTSPQTTRPTDGLL